ncbi:MAG: ribosomal protein S18-alanine N-acetyltransferase [Gammaproteobacteria bacterium]|nr:ribosomal protein S18-alanine N-acetyltransferase [Gammaproteobacteria bacterium]
MNAAVLPQSQIRAMRPADLQAVAEVELASYQFPWNIGIFRDCLLAGYQSLVLDIRGNVSGYCIMSIAAGEAHLLNICIHPSCQRLGYGRRLLVEGLARAREMGVETIFLEVRPSNDVAIMLYRSLGFRLIGRRPSYYQADNGREDAVIFAASYPDTE